jgi:hypothetical protein
MAVRNTAVFGIYTTRAAAETAVDELISAGFPCADVSVLLPEVQGRKDLALGAVGGTFGLLAGIGALAVPGLGPLIAAGPIIGALAGVELGGRVGGIGGALIGLGIPEFEAKRYEGHVKDGGILVSVHCDRSDEVSRAQHMLQHSGAADISSTGESRADAKAEKSVCRAV